MEINGLNLSLCACLQVEEEMKLSRAFYQELEHTSFPDPRTAVEPPT